MRLYAEIINHAGRDVLVYVEHDADEPVLHIITTVSDIAQVDVKLTFNSSEEDIWEVASVDDFAAVRSQIDNHILPLEKGFDA